MNRCITCGTKLDEDGFCEKCGNVTITTAKFRLSSSPVMRRFVFRVNGVRYETTAVSEKKARSNVICSWGRDNKIDVKLAQYKVRIGEVKVGICL